MTGFLALSQGKGGSTMAALVEATGLDEAIIKRCCQVLALLACRTGRRASVSVDDVRERVSHWFPLPRARHTPIPTHLHQIPSG